jgi:hypothetical protein
MKRTSESMSSLKLGCPSRSQEKWEPIDTAPVAEFKIQQFSGTCGADTLQRVVDDIGSTRSTYFESIHLRFILGK